MKQSSVVALVVLACALAPIAACTVDDLPAKSPSVLKGGSGGSGSGASGSAGTATAGRGGAGAGGASAGAGGSNAGAGGTAGNAGQGGSKTGGSGGVSDGGKSGSGSGTGGAHAGTAGASAGTGGASGGAAGDGGSSVGGAGGAAGTVAGAAGTEAGGAGNTAGSAGASGEGGASAGSGGLGGSTAGVSGAAGEGGSGAGAAGSAGAGAGAGGAAGFTVGGTLANAAGSVTLTNSATGEALPVAANGVFTFTTPVAAGGSYDVTVSAMPNGQFCSVKRGSGVANGSVGDIAVGCSTTVGLFGRYPLDGDAKDASGNGKDLVQRDGTASWGTDRFGKPNRTFVSSATFDQQVPTPTSYTVLAWVFAPASVPQGIGFFGRTHSTLGGNSNHMLTTTDGATSFFNHYMYWDGGGMANTGFVPFVAGTWYHAAILGQTPNVKNRLYVNGVVDGTSVSQCCKYDVNNTNRWTLFGGAGGTVRIDDLRIYDAVLTDAEIKQIYDAEKP